MAYINAHMWEDGMGESTAGESKHIDTKGGSGVGIT